MVRNKQRRPTGEQLDSANEGCSLVQTRRSSLKVNLSFTSNLSDSEHGSLRKAAIESNETSEEQDTDLSRTVKKRNRNTKNAVSNDTAATPASVANVTVISAADRNVCKNKPSKSPRNSISFIKEKEQQLNKSCTELKNAIISKTQVLSDNELTRKTSEILTGCSSSVRKMDDPTDGNRSPRVRISIGKNDQLVMAGCGDRQNPVQINSMSKGIVLEERDSDNKASQDSDQNGSDCSQSIASTPKKSNIETSVDKSTGKTSKQIIKIPVARLFADNDPNNSMSEVDPIPTTETLRSNVSKEAKTSNNSHVPRISNESNTTVSPILSQGTRKSRISRLSLKRKLTTDETGSSRVSTSTTNESFVNRPPLTCSSFIERPKKSCNKSPLDEHTKTIILEEKSESSENQKTINLDDNENNTNTINIDQSSKQSSMEITTISARTPIVREPFQQIIQKSFNFEKADIPGNNTLKSNTSNQQSTNKNDSSIKKTRESVNIEKNNCQDECSTDTGKISLNVNTSLDDISLAERVGHKENKKPSSTKQLAKSKNITGRGSQTLTTMRSSLRVNTSLDSVRKSSDNSKTDSEPEKRGNAQLQSASSNSNQEKEDSSETRSHRPSTGTVRSSMQVNTSLDSVQKSPSGQEPLNYNKILSMVEEAPSTDNSQALNLQCQSSDNNSDIENTPLSERIQNNSALKNKQTPKEQNSLKESRLEASIGKSKSNLKRKSSEPESSCPRTKQSKVNEKNESKKMRRSNDIENTNLEKSGSKNSESDTAIIRRKSSRKLNASSTRRTSVDNENVSSTTNESSIVEATPFPASRSLLFKTIIKNNIAMNTLNPRKLVDSSDEEGNDGSHLTLSKKAKSSHNKRNSVLARKRTLSDHSTDTVILNTSDESSNELNKKKERVVIDDSMNDTGNQNKSKTKRRRRSKKQRDSKSSDSSDEEETNKKLINKRKLYPLRENSQISFSPAEMTEAPRESVPKDMNVKRKKKRKMALKKPENVESVSPEPAEECDHPENEVSIPKPEKKKKKPRKIKSKKIVVKKVTNLTLLGNMLENDEQVPLTSDRSSLGDFDLRRRRDDTRKESKHHKIVIVVTGHDKDDRDLVKNVVKTLGSAILQANVTPRTTHVIGSGVRTINLLKGIIRGCWLLTLEWVLKSLESEKWLDPSPYEMSHFAKAVQVNRRDRQIMGKSYVPELFVTCGPMYIKNGTIPPTSALKDLVKTAGGRITDDPNQAKIIIGLEGLKENWILDSITTGDVQPFDQYKRN